MSDFAAFQQRKGELRDALGRLIELVGQGSVVPNPEVELRKLDQFQSDVSGDLVFKVLCVGDFSTGKSTFINRFLLGQDLLPAFPAPTTTVPTRIRYGERLRALLYCDKGEPGEVTEGIREGLKDWVSTDGGNAEGIRGVVLEEAEDYRKQSEQLRRDLKRALKLEFQAYRDQLSDLFDRVGQEVAQLIQEIAVERQDAKRVNTRLAGRMSRRQEKTKRRLREIDDAFLERIKALVETQKGCIDAPPSSAVTLDEYFLRWPGVAQDGQNLAGPVSGGIGIAGLLLGAGTFLPTLAAPAAAPTDWGSLSALMFGGGTAAAASPWIVFGIPGLVVGVLALAGSRYFANLAWEQLQQKLKDLSEDLQGSIEKQKWQLIDRISEHQDARIEKICDDVDHDIKRVHRDKLAELDQIDRIQDGGEALKALRKEIADLTLQVNP